MLIQLDDIQLRHWKDPADHSRHHRPMPATRDIIRLAQILKLSSLTETPSPNNLVIEALLIDIDPIIYQCYCHWFVWLKGDFNVLDKVRKLVHTRQPFVALFTLLMRSVIKTGPWVMLIGLVPLDIFDVNVRAEALKTPVKMADVILSAFGCFQAL